MNHQTPRRISLTTELKTYLDGLAPTRTEGIELLVAWFVGSQEAQVFVKSKIVLMGQEGRLPISTEFQYKPNRAVAAAVEKLRESFPEASLNVFVRALLAAHKGTFASADSRLTPEITPFTTPGFAESEAFSAVDGASIIRFSIFADAISGSSGDANVETVLRVFPSRRWIAPCAFVLLAVFLGALFAGPFLARSYSSALLEVVEVERAHHERTFHMLVDQKKLLRARTNEAETQLAKLNAQLTAVKGDLENRKLLDAKLHIIGLVANENWNELPPHVQRAVWEKINGLSRVGEPVRAR